MECLGLHNKPKAEVHLLRALKKKKKKKKSLLHNKIKMAVFGNTVR
jgi:hypothetical protein